MVFFSGNRGLHVMFPTPIAFAFPKVNYEYAAGTVCQFLIDEAVRTYVPPPPRPSRPVDGRPIDIGPSLKSAGVGSDVHEWCVPRGERSVRQPWETRAGRRAHGGRFEPSCDRPPGGSFDCQS
jgi:hypothetical protein